MNAVLTPAELKTLLCNYFFYLQYDFLPKRF